MSRQGTGWVVETPDPTPGSGGYNSLVFDRGGEPHISHGDIILGDPRYTVRSGGVWSTELVDSAGVVGLATSLELSSDETPYISYLDDDIGYLKVAHKNGSWVLDIADASGNVGEYTSLELDAFDHPNMAYVDEINGDLKYAVGDGGGIYTLETVDALGNVGYHASLELDPDEVPHIAHYDATLEDLMYAVKRNGGWEIERVDEEGDVGTNVSMALDAAGNPVIAYYDRDALRLKIARRIGGVWWKEHAGPVNSGEFNSLVLDADGNPRIAYHDSNRGILQYASSAIELASPSPDETWPLGSSRMVRWDGTGRVNVSLSVDGGNSFDVFPPTEVFTSWSWLRMGVGVNRTGEGVGDYFGIGILPYTYVGQFEPRLLGELEVPVGDNLELFFRGQAGPGADQLQWGFGTGVALRLGGGR